MYDLFWGEDARDIPNRVGDVVAVRSLVIGYCPITQKYQVLDSTSSGEAGEEVGVTRKEQADDGVLKEGEEVLSVVSFA